MVLDFADFRLDSDRYELTRAGEHIAVEPLVLDLISLLAGHPGQLFSKDQLQRRLWSGKVVSDATIPGTVKSARKALGDDGRTQRFIQTVHGRGFRFNPSCDFSLVSPISAPPPATPTFFSLLVMPLQAIGGDTAVQAATRLTREIEGILKRIPLMNISTEGGHYAALSLIPLPRQIYEQSGIDYIVSGILSENTEGIRVSLQFMEGSAGSMRWSDHFDYVAVPTATDLEEVAIDVCAKLQPQINIAVLQSIECSGGERCSRALYLQAVNRISLRGCHEGSFLEAAGLLRRSIELEPGLPYPPAYLSLVLAFGYRIGVLSDREPARSEAIIMAERALDLDDMDTTVLGFCGCALADVGFVERGMMLLRKSLRINDYNPQAWVALGAAELLTGDIDQAVIHLSRGVRVSPLDGCLSVWRSLLAVALLMKNDPVAAEREARLGCEHNDKTHLPHIVLAAARLRQDDRAGACRALNEAYRVRPELNAGEIRQLVGQTLEEQLLLLREGSGSV